MQKVIEKIKASAKDYLITREPENHTKSHNGGDYHRGYALKSPEFAFDQGLISLKRKEELDSQNAKILLCNHLLRSDYEDQGWSIEEINHEKGGIK